MKWECCRPRMFQSRGMIILCKMKEEVNLIMFCMNILSITHRILDRQKKTMQLFIPNYKGQS